MDKPAISLDMNPLGATCWHVRWRDATDRDVTTPGVATANELNSGVLRVIQRLNNWIFSELSGTELAN